MAFDRSDKRAPRRSRPMHVRELVAQLVTKHESPAAPERRRGALTIKVFSAFERLGPPISLHAEPIQFRAGSLSLVVDDPTWLTELSFLRTEIIGRLNSIIGREAVKELRMRHGRLSRQPPKSQVRLQPPKLAPQDAEKIEEWASLIPEPSVREAMMRAARWAIGTKKR
jgi:hypothetical protein